LTEAVRAREKNLRAVEYPLARQDVKRKEGEWLPKGSGRNRSVIKADSICFFGKGREENGEYVGWAIFLVDRTNKIAGLKKENLIGLAIGAKKEGA